jgi:hypothetical protein
MHFGVHPYTAETEGVTSCVYVTHKRLPPPAENRANTPKRTGNCTPKRAVITAEHGSLTPADRVGPRSPTADFTPCDTVVQYFPSSAAFPRLPTHGFATLRASIHTAHHFRRPSLTSGQPARASCARLLRSCGAFVGDRIAISHAPASPGPLSPREGRRGGDGGCGAR